jgi:Skp family chaperone for outer membrane proteins
MMKTAIAAAVFVALVSGAAFAQEAPAKSPEDCLKAAFDIAQAAEGKNLANEQLDKVEEMLTKMESHCDAKQYSEAAAVATDLKTLISKQ